MLQVADSFIEDAGLNEEDEEGRDEEIEVPWFVLFCPSTILVLLLFLHLVNYNFCSFPPLICVFLFISKDTTSYTFVSVFIWHIQFKSTYPGKIDQ